MAVKRPFEPQRPATWRERRVSKRLARARADALAEAYAHAHPTAVPHPGKVSAEDAPVLVDHHADVLSAIGAGPFPAPPSRRRPLRNPRPTRPARQHAYVPRLGPFVLACVISLLIFAGTEGAGAAVLSHPSNPLVLGVGSLLLLAGLGACWWTARGLSRRVVIVTVAVCLVFASAFTIGSLTSVVLNGKVYLATSTTARADRMSYAMLSDLQYMANADTLLAASPTVARAQYAQYGPTASHLDAISAYWALQAQQPQNLPSPVFAPIATSMSIAANWAAKAINTQAGLILQPDAIQQQNMQSYRLTFHQEFLQAGQQLGAVAGMYGIPLTSGPQE